jgi:hypothetical protein
MARVSLRALLLLPVAAWGVPACSTGAIGDVQGGGLGSGGAASQVVCTPNRQVACPCMEGMGYRVCAADGTSWGECQCGPAGGSGPTGPCGDGLCSEEDEENCHTCVEDCGACAPCDIAPECEGVQISPLQVSHQAELDIPAMTRISPAELATRVADKIATADPAIRLLVAALDREARADEHPIVTRLRDVLASNPHGAERLRAGLRQAGIESLAGYRAAHPIARDEIARLAAAHESLRAARRAARRPAAIATETETFTPMGNEFPLPMHCGAPYLRIGVFQIYVREDYDDITNDEIYCIVQAESQAGGEIRVTPMTSPIDEGDVSPEFSNAAGVFWGQLEPRDPEGNMLVTYDCVESDTDDGYANVLAAIGEAAVDIGGAIPGEAGFIILIVGVVAGVVADIWAMDGDDPIFNAQHTIDEELYYPMTRGVYWTVRRADDGGTFGSAFDWELTIKAWGCAEYGTLDAG